MSVIADASKPRPLLLLSSSVDPQCADEMESALRKRYGQWIIVRCGDGIPEVVRDAVLRLTNIDVRRDKGKTGCLFLPDTAFEELMHVVNSWRRIGGLMLSACC